MIKSREYLKRIAWEPLGPESAHNLTMALWWSQTPQKQDYWLRRYVWLGFNFGHKNLRQWRDGSNYTYILQEAMTAEDYEFFRSLLPRQTPKDSFLIDKDNKEFL